MDFKSFCPICDKTQVFSSCDDYWSCRDSLQSDTCPLGGCVTRERALASTFFEIYPKLEVVDLVVYESSPCMRGLSLWLDKQCKFFTKTGYFPKMNSGEVVEGLRNENLEALSLANESVDVWMHLDVLEHLYHPFDAMREIYRTLKPGGRCLFTVPTYSGSTQSEQVAWMLPDGSVKISGDPEFHGNPQHPGEGSLVTWRYGYDLPLLIQREAGFDVEVRRWQHKRNAVMGPMNEVYICLK